MKGKQMNMNPEMMQQGDPLAEAGRATDTMMAHLTPGEVVIPAEFMTDPQFAQILQAAFQVNGMDMAEYVVGDPANKINPETGYPEFFKFKRFFRRIAPFAGLALALVPGLQGLGTGLGSALLGSEAAGASTLGNALIGGGLGLAGGGASGALTGAALGGLGANIGNLPGAPLGQNVQGPVQAGSGILGSIGNATGLTQGSIPSIGGGLLGSSGGGSSFNPLSLATSAIGGLQQNSAIKKQRDQLLEAQNQQFSNLENLNPEDVQNDPGYQFNLAQGQEGLNRALGAQGNLFSGAALKAAAQYNQDFANNYYNQAYQRRAAKIGAQNDIYGNRGSILGTSTLARSNNLNQTLANLTGGNVGSFNGQNNLGGFSNEQLIELMRQRGLM